jgi:Tol biopolymer transport system component
MIAFKWAPDSKSILYARNENGVGDIWSVPIDGRAPRQLTTFNADSIFAFDVSPENRLVISRGNFVSDVVLIKNVREEAGQPSATSN